MIGMPPARPDERMEKITLEDAYGPIHFYLLPFIRPSMVKEITGCDEKGAALTYEEALRRMIQRETIDASHRNVFVSHQFYLPAGKEASEVERMDSEMVTVGHIDAVPASLLSPFDYAALGHIHKPMKVGGEPYRYCGTPLPYSVSEAAQDKGILLVEMREKGFLSVEALPLLPLRPLRRLKGPADALLRQGTTDYVSLCLTDPPGGEADFDLWDRLRFAFPNLLEIQREAVFSPDYRAARAVQEKTPDTYSLCLSFLGEVDEEKKRILRDILTSIGEGESL